MTRYSSENRNDTAELKLGRNIITTIFNRIADNENTQENKNNSKKYRKIQPIFSEKIQKIKFIT